MTKTFLQSTCLHCGAGKPLQLPPGWHSYCYFFFCLFVLRFANCQQRLHMSGELKFWEKQRQKKVEKKIAGSYVTASWELAGVQESCSVNLRKLGQPCMRLRRVCSAPCWQRERKKTATWSLLTSPGLCRHGVYREAGGVIWGRLAESVWQRM